MLETAEIPSETLVGRSGHAWRQRLALAGFLLLTAALLLAHGMAADLDHDEHQFIASGALLARRGLLPYRDYPYFHMPNLAFVYALIFRRAGYLLLSARLVSIACGVMTVAMTFAVCYRSSRVLAHGARWSFAVAGSLLLLANPLFQAADGLAWNHDAAEVLLAAAAFLMLREMGRGYRAAPLAVCGLLLGLSIATRLTVAPATAVFAGMILADRTLARKSRWIAVLAFCAGMLVALIPSLWLLASAPRGFLFGNFQYAQLNTLWRHGGLHPRDVSPLGKLLAFGAVLTKPGDLLLLAILACGFVVVRRFSPTDARAGAKERAFLALLVLFLLVGSFAPSPSFAVYFYAPVPFAIWWSAYALAPFAAKYRAAIFRSGLAIIAACLVLGIQPYRGVTLLGRPRDWVPVRIHATGESLRQLSGPGPVLTLAPIFPLEGGRDIYEAYATGPFVPRVADRVEPRLHATLHVVGPEDLPALLKARPPAAVLLGFEAELEQPLKRSVRIVPPSTAILTLRKSARRGRVIIVAADPTRL